MRLPDLLVPSDQDEPVESASARLRRWVVVVATLVVGTALLRVTLSESRSSFGFGVVGLLLSVTWLGGGVLAGPLPGPSRRVKSGAKPEIFGAFLLGVAAFGVFVAADLVAEQIPVLAHGRASVLPEATATTALLLVVVVANAVGEEVFFRGAVQTAFGRRYPVLFTTALYTVATMVTLNVALVIAAAVMGTLFSIERRSSCRVVAPVITHMTWSVLILLALPR